MRILRAGIIAADKKRDHIHERIRPINRIYSCPRSVSRAVRSVTNLGTLGSRVATLQGDMQIQLGDKQLNGARFMIYRVNVYLSLDRSLYNII